MTTTLQILSFILLSAPTCYELYNDRNGDLNKKRDVIIRALLMVSFALLCWCLLHQNFFASLNLSVAIFFLLFDYIIILILNRNVYEKKVHWFTFLGTSSAIDKLSFWVKLGPWGRFGIRVGYFVVALVLFLKSS